MNRPEPIELENNLGPDAVTGEINRVPWMAYDVDEMDLYIAELEQKLSEKDKEIESLKASHYAEMVDAGMENRRLKEELRWRKFSEEKPEHHQWILVFYPNHSQFTTGVELRRWDNGCKYDVEEQELYEKWMPLPSAPKEEK